MTKDQEIEVKFYVRDLTGVEKRLVALQARLVQPRVHELNLRFDTPSGDLRRGYRVLRLRQDTAARLTYKGPAEMVDGVRVRQEIEFTVGDFQAALSFLQALDYQVIMMYEKFRAVYDLDETHVTLDELPYGNFVEIEGPDVAAIQAVNKKLGLSWEANIEESYTFLFERLRQRLNLPFRDLVFERFQGLSVSAVELHVRPAD